MCHCLSLSHTQTVTPPPLHTNQARDPAFTAQISAATCLRHLALDQERAEAMGATGLAVRALATVLEVESGEDIRQKAAACVANIALDLDSARAALCASQTLLAGAPPKKLDHVWEGYHESRRCSRDTYPDSYITKYTSIRSSGV